MAISFINSPEHDFSLGIDARSSENLIASGFVKDLLNADVVETRVRKRAGYQGFAGNEPVRITRIDYDSVLHTASFTLDSTVSLSSPVSLDTIRSSPLVIYGRSSSFTAGQGPITITDSAHYYNKFTVPTRKSFIAPGGTLAIPASEHGIGTTNMFIGVNESTSLTDRSHTKVITDSIDINETSFDVSINYTTYINRNVFVYFSDQSPVNGKAYVATLAHSGSGSETFSIPTSTHNLTSYNIVCQVQQDIGPSRIQIIPEQFIIASNGDVSITIDNVTATTYYLLLSAAPITNVISGVVNATSSGTVTIPTPTNPWVFMGIYLEQTPGGNKELVYPDAIDYDAPSNTFTVSFTNDDILAKNFIVYYEYGDVRSNRLTVADSSVTVTGTDLSPQLTMWGLDHAEIYPTKLEREGWVNYIDSYRRSGEQRLISGLGGNLFSAREFSEAASTYLYPTLYPRLFARSSSNAILGPLFYNTGDTPARTRGYITGNNSGTNWAKITSVSYDSGTQLTVYTLSIPGKQILDVTGTPTSLSAVVSTTTGLEDWVTIQDMSYARHNGVFRIVQAIDGVDQIQLWVDNTANDSIDWNDSGTGGLGAVFTDQITWTAQAPFVAGDTLTAVALDSSNTVRSSLGSVTVSDEFVSLLQVPGGVLFNGARTSSLIPMRSGNPSSAPSAVNLVRGDMLAYTGIPRELRVLNINPDTDRTCDITGDGNSVTVTMTSGDTSFLTAGQEILLVNASVHSGVHTIDAVTSLITFTYSSTLVESISTATLIGDTVQVDEELSWQDTPGDSNVFQVERRWIPYESPDDSFNLTPSTTVRHFNNGSYSNQSFVRSTMVVDNMYLTNGIDEPYKLDGTNIYRSGLPSWQPGAFLTQDIAGASKIVCDLRTVAYSAIIANQGKITITAATTNILPVGTDVKLTGSSLTYKVTQYMDDGTTFYLLLDRSLDTAVSASGSVNEIGVYRYYYRLNAVDANDNVTASAVTGYQDHVVELTQNAAVQHKLIGFPAWDNYDYDRLEVQIYRTKKNLPAPFYLVTTLPMSFNNTTGYLQFRDAFADSDLTQLDTVNTALKGQEIGTAWSDPLRAKYTTTMNNRLILGNLKDYPELDMQIVGDATLSNSTYAGDSFLFRRDSTDILTTTNMVDRVRYQWVNGFTGNASAFTIGTNQFTFTISGTLPAAGSWVYLTYSTVAITGRNLDYCGWYQVVSAAGSQLTVNLVGAAAATAYPDKYVLATVPTDVPVLLGVDGSLGMVNGDSFDTFDVMRRLSIAINTTMRQTDITLSGQELFTPWIMARGGNDTIPGGRIIIRQPRADAASLEVVPSYSGYDLFINQIKRTTDVAVLATTRVYPSRLLMSYPNYPEIFDNPGVVLDTDSVSTLDINSADGQEITGIIPFFGSAVFTSAQQLTVLVVFKTNSIYLVDVYQKSQGNQSIQRLETEGLGCTAPYSITTTKNGIMFANESGMYCLRTNHSIEYIGRYMERNWVERVSLPNLEIAQGTHYGQGRMYKLSVPLVSDAETNGYISNTEAYVYNHTGEDTGRPGSWARYDNHPATGWANLNSNAFFGSSTGRVFILRKTGTETDFRDDNLGVSFSLETRPNDFGNSGIRKILDRVIVKYRVGETNTGTMLLYAVDLETEYTDTNPLNIIKPLTSTGIDDVVSKSVYTIMHSVGRRRGVYFNVQILNSTVDEDLEIAGMDYKVGGLTNKGITQAGQT